ncbi:phosphatidylinositol-3-phosphatase [Entomortierella parvispora]|uniref:Phosphatidylinositol-3-phosphatase n=1 Tax=Entomortierella parvispora TaxID=205924 RepID=A0A9P3LS05_9FUNG|nr:phosphatidylinositol-3-phosphatase [Entomortierella parvispora]
MLLKSIVSLACIAAAAAQATKGKIFDHIFIIYLENTDFVKAAQDANLTSFADQAVLLDNYYGVTHPSEPNYIAVSGGDYFGLNDDNFHSIPANYTTVVDLLEKKNLTWKAYQEDLPSVCYQGFESDALYFRKHNPFIIYDSVALNTTRCSNIVPATQLATDLSNNDLPNYSFYTPNMLNDGHNTTVAYASAWLKSFLPPLLENKSFINNTLVVLTFDESDTYDIENRVYTLLLGDVIADLKNTTDSTFYTHYSILSTVEANWDLGNLGRQDTNSTVNNVFEVVAKAAGITNNNITMENAPLLNGTEPGFLAPAPTTSTSAPAGSQPTGSAASFVSVPKVFAAVAALAGAFAAMI